MSSALPGPPVATADLLARIENRFQVDVLRRGAALGSRLGIETRHLCRDFDQRHEAPRPGNSNPDLAATALQAALDDAGLTVGDLAYIVGHTATPACLIPPNLALVAERVDFAGPYMELRRACTGFANALVVAQGLLSSTCIKAVAIVGSETGSVYFDPRRVEEDPGQLVNLVMMGDGAGAVIVGPDSSQLGPRISGNFFGHIGLGRTPGLSLSVGGSDKPFVEREALEFAHDFVAVRNGGPELFYRGSEAARELGFRIETVDHVIPHQANGRMAELLGPSLASSPATYSSIPISWAIPGRRRCGWRSTNSGPSLSPEPKCWRWELKRPNTCSADSSMSTAEVCGGKGIANEVVAVERIRKHYARQVALQDLSLTLRKGEVLGLIGANGGGKTTTLRILSGILKPDRGRGHVLGFDLLSGRDQIHEHVGYMSQRLALYADLTVLENLRFRAEIFGLRDSRAAVETAIQEFELAY
jgi:3-oxoacyl-[acyl-carrier-protein] synthase-3